ncbi:MAG: DNA recombination protein RmuC [Deltaproteobacteria bacterium]|nr:DNA recombination protein RmuC [Deltaproteobacteria bacterium]
MIVEVAIVLGVLVLALIAGLLLWIGLAVKRGSSDDGGEEERSLLALKTEADSIRHELNDVITNNISLVNEQLSRVTTQVSEQLSSVTGQLQTSTGQINTRMDNAARVVGEVNKSLGELGKATERVFDVGKDIAGLQEILKAPKLRGELGEFFLGDLLSQILPTSNFTLQYSFKNGTRVDAVIQFKDGLVPVDSKFPLENFQKFLKAPTEEEKKKAKRTFVSDVKKRIDEIADNYIQPDAGTFNFALMYIPAENVYYETIIKDEAFGDDKQIAAYAFSRRVIPVSPNSFYAYLQTILLGLKGFEVSLNARQILKHLDGLKVDFAKFTAEFDVLGKHVGNTRNKFDDAQKKLDRFGEKLGSTGSLGDGGEGSELSGGGEKQGSFLS